jgi:hypothetical protein
MAVPEIQESIATRIAVHAQAKYSNFSIDPLTIITIINCVISVVRLLYMCYFTDRAVASSVKSNSLLHKIVLKRQIRKRFQNKDERKAMYGAMLNVSSNLSERELNDLLESI